MKHLKDFIIDYIELYVPLAKPFAYWHNKALGFNIEGYAGMETGVKGFASYYLTKNNIRLVITTAYPPYANEQAREILSYVNTFSVGVKRVALRVPSVKDAFSAAVAAGAIPIKFPATQSNENGVVEEASIRLYDHSEITFSNREQYQGVFKPGYEKVNACHADFDSGFASVDHIASELRVNEISFWTDYLSRTIGTKLVQNIAKGPENKTGMVLNINQSADKNLTLVMAEPDGINPQSKIQKNIDLYGAGIHHLAFSTDDLPATVKLLRSKDVEFVKFPKTYYELLRQQSEFEAFNIDELEEEGILIDKEGDTYLLQKFVKPAGDRPYFFYEIVQRVNGYNGFALKNINVLKKAEELEIMRTNELATA